MKTIPPKEAHLAGATGDNGDRPMHWGPFSYVTNRAQMSKGYRDGTATAVVSEAIRARLSEERLRDASVAVLAMLQRNAVPIDDPAVMKDFLEAIKRATPPSDPLGEQLARVFDSPEDGG